MLLKHQLIKDRWYKGFHPQFSVAKWTGHTFASFEGSSAYYCNHKQDWEQGFEPVEEIEPPHPSLQNHIQLSEEIKQFQDKADNVWSGLK